MARQSHESNSGNLALTHNRYGITEFSEGVPDNCKADIVFVHGLTGNSDSTWRHENAELPWPEELLARDISDCKILKYDYKISAVGHLDKNTLRDLAADLLSELVNWRRENESERPIIFVAHSLGGLLVKRILPESQSRDPPYNIGALTRGVIFLGTPHCASRLKPHGYRILRALQDREVETNIELRAIFQPASDILEETHRSFMKWLRERNGKAKEGNGNVSKPKVHITSFYEGLPLREEVTGFGDITVVDSDLAFIEGGYNFLALQCDYKTMAKPPVEKTGSDSGDYCSVRDQIVLAVRFTQPEDELALADTARSSENALKERKAFLRSFAFSEVRERFQTVSAHLEGTFQWIERNDTFTSWLELPGMNVLHLAGKRASGKSTFMKYLTNDEALVTWARLKNPSRKTIVISHFFHYAGQDPSRTFEGFLRSILFQLVEADSDAFEQAEPVFRGLAAHQSAPTWPRDDLKKACLKVFKYWGTLVDHQRPIIYLVVDAWNHLDGDIYEMTSFLQKLFELCGRRLKLCISSTREAKIDNAVASLASLGVLPRVEIEKHTRQDIEMFIKENYPTLTEIHVGEEGTLADAIENRAKGVFLWVRLVCANLINRAITSTEVTKASADRLLSSLQPDLEEFYEMMFNSIEPDVRDEVEKVLSIVIAASRRLTAEELQCAVFFSDNDNIFMMDNKINTNNGINNHKRRRLNSKISKGYLTDLDVFNRDLQTVIETRCRGFLQITRVQGDGAGTKLIIEPCHGTASTYLTKHCKPQGPGEAFKDLVTYGHSLLCEASTTYLSYLEKKDLPPEASEILGVFTDAKDDGQLVRFESNEDNNTSSGKWSKTVHLDKGEAADFGTFCKEYPFVSYSAENWGHHVKSGCAAQLGPVEALEGDTFSCFLWVFWELMEARRANPYTPSDLPLDALEYLSSLGCASYLLHTLNRRPDRIIHPERLLLSTIRAKSALMVDHLLQHYAVKKLNANQGEQAVLQAIDFSYNPKGREPYELLIKSLLRHGFPADKKVQYTIRDEHWNTSRDIRIRKRQFESNPLLLAILLQRNRIAELLLTHSSCRDAVRKEVNWVLHRVLEMAADIQPVNIEGIELLVDNGASTMSTIPDLSIPQATPLGKALSRKELAVAETLLDCGADANFRGDHASQLSVVAEAENDNPKCVPLLLHWGARVDVWSMEQGCNKHPAAKGVKDVISVLMDHLHEKGDIDRLIENRETALHIAIRYGRKDLVERLIQKLAADVNIPDHNGDYPVHVALRQSEAMTYIKLLQRSPTFDKSAQNSEERTCFRQAKFKGQYSLVRELRECGMGEDELDFEMEEDPQEDPLAVIPYPDASKTKVTFHLQGSSGGMILQTRPEDTGYSIDELSRGTDEPWNALRHSMPQGIRDIDSSLRGLEIWLPTQSEVVSQAPGNLPLLEGAITDEMGISFGSREMGTPSISDTSGDEFLAGTGSWSGHEVDWQRE
ncbi:hypothetical protein LCI18_002184 [Fusarium solani-melongenae]|uniref:Uncharacterized protein n=1 Tax=Fusarium solani subsp. cucurbitae TaxID=2747967 RepID=A0ACD3YQI7_FUSSC|nr:hypothetical protein LCI18_002184 [Fusarium solani-melongenae]